MTKEDAIVIAKGVLSKEIDLPDDDEFIVVQIEKRAEGWFIEFNSKQFMETDDLLYALVIAPLMIREDGSHRFVF